MPLLNLLLLSTFGDHLAAVRWNSRWPARSARSAASRRPPKPPKRPHCHLTRFLSWLCVRCAQQPRKFVWRLRIDADIKKNLHTNKTLFEPTFRIKKANYYNYQEWINKTKKMPVQDWVIDEIFRNEKFEVRIPYTTINTNSENSDYKYVCLSVATFSVLRSNFFQKYPWFIVSIEEKQTTWNPKKHFFLFEKERKNPKCDFFFRMKNPLRRSWRRLKSRREE